MTISLSLDVWTSLVLAMSPQLLSETYQVLLAVPIEWSALVWLNRDQNSLTFQVNEFNYTYPVSRPQIIDGLRSKLLIAWSLACRRLYSSSSSTPS